VNQLTGIILTVALTGVLVGDGWVLRRVVKLGEDLAVIRQQLTPAGEKPLHARVEENASRITVIETHLNLRKAVPQ
jgi:hypothetical protein